MASTLETVEVKSRAALRQWLDANHESSPGIWLVTWKKQTPHHLPYPAVVEEALCFGWIDSLPRKLDAERSMIQLTPRKPKSGWSAVNKQRIDKLIHAGLMMPAGLAMIEAAKASGTWTKLDSAHAREIPPDLLAAFEAVPNSAETFAGFPASAQKGILEWISHARKPETRAKRVRETATLAARNIRANTWVPPHQRG